MEVSDGFVVRDDGIGISKKTGGTGLGLAIVKHIIELHNGTIENYG